MTDEVRLACTDPGPMLEFLRGKASDRKLRLFAAACCRAMWKRLTDVSYRWVVEAAERFADGQVSESELQTALGAADTAFGDLSGTRVGAERLTRYYGGTLVDDPRRRPAASPTRVASSAGSG